jgi:crotonobetainyl-CoA:carnitine CoA-transferase CaiB-like acyl-CoA transferase
MVIGNPVWTRDPRFATFRGRKENEDELNALVEEWTVDSPPVVVMNQMQAAGVPAGMAASAQDLVADPQLNHRGTHAILEHPEIGHHIYQPPPYRLSGTPAELTMPAPCIGQHNEYILKDVLGMSDEEVADLIAAGGLE